MDLLNKQGELDRTKVLNELHRIIDHDFRPDEDELIALIDEVQAITWREGVAEGRFQVSEWA